MTTWSTFNMTVQSAKVKHGIHEAEVRRIATLAFDPQRTVELRASLPARKGAASSRVLGGGDLDGIARAAKELSGGGTRHVYYTLNPTTLPAGQRQAAKDEHVLRRRWLLL